MRAPFQGKGSRWRMMGVSRRGDWDMGLSHLQTRSSHTRYVKVGHNIPFTERERVSGAKD